MLPMHFINKCGCNFMHCLEQFYSWSLTGVPQLSREQRHNSQTHLSCLDFANLTETRGTWEEETQCFHEIGPWHVCGTLSWLMIYVGGLSPIWAMPPLDRWSCLYKTGSQTRAKEQASKQHSSMVSASVLVPRIFLQFLTWFPLMVDSNL